MNIYVLVGLILILGFVLGQALRKLRITEILAYILAGIVIGRVLNFSPPEEFSAIITGTTLALVAYIVGLTFSFAFLRRLGKQMVIILIVQVIMTFVATGGFGRVYGYSTNALINTGDGVAAALRAGVPLKDMEFVQFHPTTLYPSGILITEGARGEGGYLVNTQGERFMDKYAPKQMELAPRDIVARAIQTEINEGRGFEDAYVHLELKHLGPEKIKERLPGIREISMFFAGVDPIVAPIPVRPGQHYSMGGIHCDKDGVTPIRGLYAVGETACMSAHGANRLGGNSLLETLVFGRLVGQKIKEHLSEDPDVNSRGVEEAAFEMREKLQAILLKDSGESAAEIRAQMGEIMDNEVGVFRNQETLESALKAIRFLKITL